MYTLPLRPRFSARYMIPTIMAIVDPAGEFLRLAEHYRNLTDGELVKLARQRSALTDMAQQALSSELWRRKVTVEAEEEGQIEEATTPEVSADSPYEEDRKLMHLCTVWSVGDALQVQMLLDRAGIPFFMGAERATGVDKVTSNFASGVDVQIMKIGLPWATQAMQDYEPGNEPPLVTEETRKDISVHCPKCGSIDVVLHRLKRGPGSEIYPWACDACGHRWEDEGIVED